MQGVMKKCPLFKPGCRDYCILSTKLSDIELCNNAGYRFYPNARDKAEIEGENPNGNYSNQRTNK